jgi:hypothetical protein
VAVVVVKDCKPQRIDIGRDAEAKDEHQKCRTEHRKADRIGSRTSSSVSRIVQATRRRRLKDNAPLGARSAPLTPAVTSAAAAGSRIVATPRDPVPSSR